MGLLGVVGGHSILGMIGDDGTAFGIPVVRRPARGVNGPVVVLDAGHHVILQRHGLDGYVPAHRVDHVGNMSALAGAGCDRVLAISSVGSLRTELPVGAHLVPDDFIALDHPPSAVYGDERGHVVPGFTPAWRAQVIEAWRGAGVADVVDGGVYWQANGPRFETPAEIRLIAVFADVVGMTVGAECVAANELGLGYAAACIVDNLANGLDDRRLTPEEFAEGKHANQARLLQVLTRVLTELVAVSLAVVGATLDGAPVGLRAVDGSIVALGPGVGAEPGDEVLDGGGCLLFAGLVNGHTHAAMTLLRGFGSDLRLLDWLEQKIWPAEARLTDDDVYWGTRLACVEMIRSGTVRFWDMYWQPGAVARAVTDAGLRASVGLPLVDGMDPTRAKEVQTVGSAVLDELSDAGARVDASVTPHSIYTVSADTLAWAAAEADARGVALHIHFLEIEAEVSGCLERYGERPGQLLDRLGVLGPWTILAHGVWMEEPELELVAARGCTIVTNPVSNLKLAVGRIFPYQEVRDHGIAVGLGTDGASSNNSLDLLADVKVLALLQKHAQNDPAALPADEAWDVVTGALAPALGQEPFAVGARADFVLVRGDAPELAPGNALANLVYAASGAVVDATVVDGRVLMRRGVIEGEEEVRVRAVEAARRLGVLEP